LLPLLAHRQSEWLAALEPGRFRYFEPPLQVFASHARPARHGQPARQQVGVSGDPGAVLPEHALELLDAELVGQLVGHARSASDASSRIAGRSTRWMLRRSA